MMKTCFRALILGLIALVLPACDLDEPVKDLAPAGYTAALDVPGGRESYGVWIHNDTDLSYTIDIIYNASALKEGERSVYPKDAERIYEHIVVDATYSLDADNTLRMQAKQAKRVGFGSEQEVDLEDFLRTHGLRLPDLRVERHRGENVLLLERLSKTLYLQRISHRPQPKY